ncbi:MAG: endonuclease, partial [Hydrogenovibrio sp.]|uniref:endonuclease n=1 Tax=Hydrogenovibrio sp. TaxID=2065821 RepID=UPI00287082E5
IGQINAHRSNKPFGEKLSGTKEQTYRGIGMITKVSSRIFVPDPSIRGDIARIAFYMRDTYGVDYSRRQLQVFERWNVNDPVSYDEYRLNKRIEQAQGRGNHYVRRR